MTSTLKLLGRLAFACPVSSKTKKPISLTFLLFGSMHLVCWFQRALLPSKLLSVFPAALPSQIPAQLLYFVTDCDYQVFNIHANGGSKPAVTAGRS